ncbi:copper chaperone PCu(A)C [Sedimentitalea sp. XS_ASV28]|uniref:copper chaperone PCu(A)C n=1 Tax=Sedimentitalea sp. XS_ASV28 TaxID=3241296 RepID=UPI003512F71A
MTSDQIDRLIAITTPAAARAMIHVVEADSAGIIRMTPLDALDLPPNTPVVMAPGDMHVMLVDLPKKLEEGTTFPLTLAFEMAGEVTIEVRVLGPGSSGPDGE